MRLTRIAAAAAISLGAASPATLSAQTWTSWNSAAGNVFNGTLLGTSVTFTGNYVGGQLTGAGGTDYFSPNGAYTQSGLTSPDAGGNYGFIQFDPPVRGQFTFGAPVTNLYLALISVGQPGYPVTYTFDHAFTVLSNNNAACAYWGCGSYSATSLTLTGSEFSGTLQFAGALNELTLSTAPNENWHGVTVGADAVSVTPEPATLWLMGSGLAGFAGMAHRRRRRAA
jgi:hypothetical protein